MRLTDGSHLIAGKAVTGFPNVEEKLMGLSGKVPFLTESAMRERGAAYEHGTPFLSHVVASGRLVTGQNPRSTRETARKLLELLAGQR